MNAKSKFCLMLAVEMVAVVAFCATRGAGSANDRRGRRKDAKPMVEIAHEEIESGRSGTVVPSMAKQHQVDADFPDLNAVYKEFNPKTNSSLNQGDGQWLDYAYPKGGYSKVSHTHRNGIELRSIELKFLELKTGKFVLSDYFTHRIEGAPKIGSIIAYPRSDFEVEREFTYVGKNAKGEDIAFQGMLVNVKVILGYPAGATKLPTELVCCKTVENLAKSGMPIPDTVGKAGKIKSLVDSAKLRYGAKTAKYFCAANPEGKVQILLLNVDSEKAKENVLPATY